MTITATEPTVAATDAEALPAPVLGDDPDWVAAAVCASTDPEIFFPEKGGSTRSAKAICRRCPVAAECLAAALARDERFGIWGGLSERDRRALTAAEPKRGARTMRTEITDILILTLLKHLVAGRSAAFTAAACGLPQDKVTRIAADYGYPGDPMKMAWGIEILEGENWRATTTRVRAMPATVPAAATRKDVA
jgi:WhiB family redox-sensing transcriptional regulator